jgi:hypothetical protein
MRFGPGTSRRRDAGPAFPLERQARETAVDILLAVLYPLTWLSPNLLYPGLFEVLAACLSGEILALFVLAILGRRFRAGSHAGLRRDWIFVRFLLLGYLAFLYAQSVPWGALLALGIAVVGASFPLRVTSHPDWPARLQHDTVALVIVAGLAFIAGDFLALPAAPDLRLPDGGFVLDLVVKHRVAPAQVLATGSAYYLAKAIITGRRVLEERRLRAAGAAA